MNRQATNTEKKQHDKNQKNSRQKTQNVQRTENSQTHMFSYFIIYANFEKGSKQ